MLNHSFYVNTMESPINKCTNCTTTCYIIDLRDLLDLPQISELITRNQPKTFLYLKILYITFLLDFWER